METWFPVSDQPKVFLQLSTTFLSTTLVEKKAHVLTSYKCFVIMSQMKGEGTKI